MGAPSQSSPERNDDEILVGRIRGGDEHSFLLFYKRHARYIAGVVFRLLGQDSDLDDIVQETFSTAAARIDQVRAPAQVRLWLVQIAVHLAQKRMKARKRQPLGNGQEWDVAGIDSCEPRMELKALETALSELSPKLRTPWVLHRVEDMTLEQVAQVCGTSLATTKRRLASAEAKLRRKLDDAR